MNRIITAATILLSIIAISCNREDDDLIPEPSATSTIITGIVSTADGKPLADIPVGVDYENRSIIGNVLLHKAKGKTDNNGRYRLFFDIDEKSISVTSEYRFTVNLSGLSAETYLLPDDQSLSIHIYPDDRQGETLSCDIAIPRKKPVDVTVNAGGATLEKGEYAVRNVFSYGSGWENLSKSRDDEGSKLMTFSPVEIGRAGQASVKLPCAVGVTNAVTVVYLGNDEVKYGWGKAVSDTIRIDPSDAYAGKITIDCH